MVQPHLRITPVVEVTHVVEVLYLAVNPVVTVATVAPVRLPIMRYVQHMQMIVLDPHLAVTPFVKILSLIPVVVVIFMLTKYPPLPTTRYVPGTDVIPLSTREMRAVQGAPAPAVFANVYITARRKRMIQTDIGSK